jgi:hypothetical protein
MTQLEDLQGRISAALDTIAQTVERYQAPVATDTSALEEQLAQAEKATAAVQAQLELAKSEHEDAVEMARDQAASQARAEAEQAAEAALTAAVEKVEAEKAAALKAAASANAQLDELREQMAAAPAARVEAPAAQDDGDGFSPDPGIEVKAPAAPAAEPADDGELNRLRDALEEEKMANAQLEERYSVLIARMKDWEANPPVAPAPVAKPVDMSGIETEMKRLRRTVAELEDSNRALREANAQGVGDAHLINKSMLSELESLRAARASEVAEGQAILSALEPLLADAAQPVEEAN